MDSDTGKEPKEKEKRGRPKSRILNIDATPQYAARAIFAAADAKIKKGPTKKKERSSLPTYPIPSAWQLRYIIPITKLLAVFDSYDDEQKAVESFS